MTIKNDLNQKFVAAYEKKYNETPGKIEALGFATVWFCGERHQGGR